MPSECYSNITRVSVFFFAVIICKFDKSVQATASRADVSGYGSSSFPRRQRPMISGTNHTISGEASNVEIYDLVILQ